MDGERRVSGGRRALAAFGLLLGGLLMTGQAPVQRAGFLEALRAGGPADDRGGARDLYGPLIGSWEGEVVDHLGGGAEQRQSAEFHFAWVLEGRAVQDLWIAPARSERPRVPGTG